MVLLAGLEALPPGSCLLHIGQMKTGTTTLQHAASSQRDRLLGLGVCYPGRGLNHNRQASAAMRREAPAWGGAPPMAAWDRLVAEIRDRPQHRSLVSFELIAESGECAARRFVTDLGPQTRVVITMRSFAMMLPSAWQQEVKWGYVGSFETWLRDVLEHRTGGSDEASRFWSRHDLVAQLLRWTPIAGAGRVLVVVLDKRRPELLTDAFEGLLGLPGGTLVVPEQDGYRANRSLSPVEIELVRRVNLLLQAQGHAPSDHFVLTRNGMIAAMQRRRLPTPEEGRQGLPRWAESSVRRIAEGFVDALAAQRVPVIGSAEALTEPDRPSVDPAPGSDVLIEIGVNALRGIISRAVGRGVDFEEPAGPASGSVPEVARPSMQDARPRRRLTDAESALSEALKTSLVGSGLHPVQREALVTTGVIETLRLGAPDDDAIDIVARAVAGVYSIAVGRGVAFERPISESRPIEWS